VGGGRGEEQEKERETASRKRVTILRSSLKHPKIQKKKGEKSQRRTGKHLTKTKKKCGSNEKSAEDQVTKDSKVARRGGLGSKSPKD